MNLNILTQKHKNCEEYNFNKQKAFHMTSVSSIVFNALLQMLRICANMIYNEQQWFQITSYRSGHLSFWCLSRFYNDRTPRELTKPSALRMLPHNRWKNEHFWLGTLCWRRNLRVAELALASQEVGGFWVDSNSDSKRLWESESDFFYPTPDVQLNHCLHRTPN